ncbi:permease-like cell division protein FtsX [soil metagenome]
MKAFVSFEHAIRSVGGSLRREPVAWLANSAVVAVAILLPLLLHLGLRSAFPFLQTLAADPEASVWFAPDAKPAAVTASRAAVEARLEQRRSALPQARLVTTFVARDEAWRRFTGNAGDRESSGALAAIGSNPLPDSLVIRASGVTPAELESLLSELRSVSGVESVDLDLDWARQIASWADGLRWVRTALAVALGLVVVAATFQATRAQVLADRDEITIARLIGATDSFVRRPFVFRGALLGLWGALLALAAAFLLAWRAEPVLDVMRLAPLYPDGLQSALVVAAAVLLGALGGYICCIRYLK